MIIKFEIEQIQSKFLPEIMTLLLSANNIGCDTEFILRARSFIYIMNNISPIIDPWGIQFLLYRRRIALPLKKTRYFGNNGAVRPNNYKKHKCTLHATCGVSCNF
jgi:hypothetical protein